MLLGFVDNIPRYYRMLIMVVRIDVEPNLIWISIFNTNYQSPARSRVEDEALIGRLGLRFSAEIYRFGPLEI